MWKDLEQAEAATIHLLQLASETTKRLAQWKISGRNNNNNNNNKKSRQNQNDDDDDDDYDDDEEEEDEEQAANQRLIASSQRHSATTHELAAAYNATIAHIHRKLAPHAALVAAYHPPMRSNRMYLTRVELRLADQKRTLLEEMVNVENGTVEAAQRASGMLEREPIQQQQQQQPTPITVKSEDDYAGGKRKREE